MFSHAFLIFHIFPALGVFEGQTNKTVFGVF